MALIEAYLWEKLNKKQQKLLLAYFTSPTKFMSESKEARQVVQKLTYRG